MAKVSKVNSLPLKIQQPTRLPRTVLIEDFVVSGPIHIQIDKDFLAVIREPNVTEGN
jgi:hypothetical protein